MNDAVVALVMPWHCPVCRSVVRLRDIEVRPRLGEPYRCHVCRLELQLNESTDLMEIAPFDGEHPMPPAPAPRRRAIPAPLTRRRKALRAGTAKHK